jgi:hypothetical protein
MPRKLCLASLLMLALRLYAARVVGYGDSEALYASYALHPALTYRDHPGLIGALARLVGQTLERASEHSTAPSPLALHVLTSIAATLLPLLYYTALRSSRATETAAERQTALDRAENATWLFLATPQIAVGLFGFTPDLLLAVFWIGALLFALRASREHQSTTDTELSLALFCASLAALSKASGGLLYVALCVWILRRFHRTAFRLASMAVCALPALVVYGGDVSAGPMLRHRLISQLAHGPSWSSLGQAIGGQLVYVSPLVFLILIFGAIHLFTNVRRHCLSREEELFAWSVAIPLLALFAFVVVSPFAEPHWLAPPMLSLAIYMGRTPFRLRIGTRFCWVAFAVAATMSAAAHAWVLVPSSAQFEPDNPSQRLAGELFGWQDAVESVLETVRSIEQEHSAANTDLPGSQIADSAATTNDVTRDVVVVGPYWTVCAQLHARLGARVDVGCLSPQGDDWDDWVQRGSWQRRRYIVFVTDERFPTTEAFLAAKFPLHGVRSRSKVRTFRGGVPARTFSVTLLARALRT